MDNLEVTSKVCSKCFVEKPLEAFHKQKGGKFGVAGRCKCCIAEYNTKLERKARQAERYAKNYQTNREEILAKKAEHNAKPEVKAKQAENYQANREEILTRQAEYDAKPEIKEQRNKREKLRKETDPLYKLTCNIRCLISNAFKNGGYSKDTDTANILGCTYEEFKEHIESQFQEGMSWDNYPEWEYDHIYPVSLAESEEHLLQLNHYTNFQPLWKEDNRRKSNKLLDNTE